MHTAADEGIWRRKAIVVADLVESVRLMRENETGTIRRWVRFLTETRERVLPAFHGRLVKSLGDGLMLEFGAPADAVAAAFDLQRTLSRHNADALEMPLRLRIGIHFADVLIDELDIYGSGVNLAARLATIARPDEIVASVDVRDAVADGIGLHIIDLGNCYLKHIEEPVRAFRVTDVPGHGTIRHGAVDSQALNVSVAVVPFAPLGDAAQAWAFGDAIADAINARLTHCSGVRVISRLSTGSLRRLSDLSTACRNHLDAAFVFHGSYVIDGDRTTIHGELCDVRDGTVHWAGSVRSKISDVFVGEDPAFEAMAAEVGAAIVSTELSRARGLPLASLAAFSLYVGGVGLLHRMRPNDFARSRAVLEALHEREPQQAAPVAMLAKWHLLRTLQGWSPDPYAEGDQARSRARQALDLDPDDGLAIAVDALLASHFDGDLAAARRRSEQAVDANPQETLGWLALAGVHSYEGHGEAAIHAASQAIARSPVDPKRFMFDLLLAAGTLAAGRATEAAEHARASLRLNSLHAPTHRLLVIALMLAGSGDAGREAARHLLALDPSFTVGTFRHRYPGRNASHAAIYMQALADAGIPQ